jgi:phosphoribosylaminoimidazole-succinocarboxamide synthase
VRDYLEGLGWNKRPPAPELPAEVVANTSRRYIEIYEKITGKALAD